MQYADSGVIFDVDGVLADTARQHFESWQAVAAHWGATVTREVFEETFGRPNHQVMARLLGREVSPEEVREVDRAKEAAFRRIVAGTLEPLPGVVELIRELDGHGFRLAVGSSGPRENIDLILGRLGVAGVFRTIVSGWDVERGKPDPDVFLKAAAGLGLPPARCLVVEDVPAGVRAAHAAGMKCVAVTTTHPADALRDADLVIGSFAGFGVPDVAEQLGLAPERSG